jgi:hypothetical protein
VSDQEAFKLAQRYSDHLTQLRNIRELDLAEQTVPSHATLDEAIDIFDLVNRQGTKLTDAELALTHITGKWPTCRREMKAKIEELNHQRFYFDLRFMTRALTGVVTQRAAVNICLVPLYVVFGTRRLGNERAETFCVLEPVLLAVLYMSFQE